MRIRRILENTQETILRLPGPPTDCKYVPLGQVRRCYNRGCMDTFTSADTCKGCGGPTQIVGGEPCDTTAGGSKPKMRKRAGR